VSGGLYRAAKRCVDLAGAAAGLAVLGPVMLGTAVAVRASMGSPVLFRQPRPGLRGEVFELRKFRTMREPRPGEERFASDADRLTRVGRFLRATSLDELPTLLNVLRGDMSLVGPRPLLVRYLDRYSAEQARRHDVKPGVTGWAQVNGRNALSWDDKLALDVWYVDHASLALDLRILGMTVARVLRRDGVSREGHATMPEFMGPASDDS
jgi:lipopolysaccharide/colanic/teichoic acid biosynthesis glycosyltransferase